VAKAAKKSASTPVSSSAKKPAAKAKPTAVRAAAKAQAKKAAPAKVVPTKATLAKARAAKSTPAKASATKAVPVKQAQTKAVLAKSAPAKALAKPRPAPAKSVVAPAKATPAKAVAKKSALKKTAVIADTAKKSPVAKPATASKSAAPKPKAVVPAKVIAKPTPKKAVQAKAPAKPAPAPKPVAARASANPMKSTEIKTTTSKPTKAVKKPIGAPLTDADVLAMPDKDYMNEAQLAFFKAKLEAMRGEILENARETGEHLKENEVFADPNDRATVEEENLLEQRVRDRERKLLKKINSSLARIEDGAYGYCLETGDPIGIPRLLARPTAELSIEAQEKHERLEKLYAD
jgi:DnaK suppressor protein